VFDSWGRAVYRRRRLVLEIAAVAVVLVASWSTGVFGKLQSSGGFTPPGS
jgi:trehalose monomycolate/heme transporter